MTNSIYYLIITIIIVYAAIQTWRSTDNKQPEIDADDDSGCETSYKNKNFNLEKETQIIKNNYVPTNLLTPTELKFYLQMKEALKTFNVEIHYKVRLADIFKVKYHNKYYKRNFARIMAKHTDFLIVEPATAKPILAIELDDASHDKEASFKNDNFKNILYGNSYIKLLRIKVTNTYDFSYITQFLNQYKKVNTTNNIPSDKTTDIDNVIKYYNLLDEQGKNLIKTVINNELDRMTK